MPEPVLLQSFKPDYRQILTMYPHQVKSIEWASFGSTPIYKAIIGDKMHYFNASYQELMDFYVTEDMIRDKLSAIHSEPVSIRLMLEYDNYYVNRERTLPLPER